MSVAIVPAASLVASGTAPAAPRGDATADAPANFAATLDRSRQALAAAPANADGAPVAAPARKPGARHEQPSDGDRAPDALALLLAGAAIASHVTPAPSRTTTPAGTLHAAPSLARADTHAADAASQKSNPQEALGHDLLAVPDRSLARAASGMDRAGDGAAASPAALAAADPARAAAPAADARAAPDPFAAGVDLAALAGRARVPARADGAAADRPHALPSAVAADAAPALPAAADAAAAALSASAFPGRDGRASHEHEAAGQDAADGPLPAALAGAAPPTSDVAATAQDATATVTPPVGSSEWAPALAQQIARLGPGRSQIQLDLHPAELGPLTVKLTIGAAQAQVMFVSEHAAVRQALEAALPQLRTSLADSGISLGQASVGGGGGQASAQAGGREAPPRRETPSRPAGSATAEPAAPARAGGTSGLDAFA